jgi:putative hydrolase of the HAD superfamily
MMAMERDEIRAVLFDLGDTILNFGKVSTMKAFQEGAKRSHAFLKEHGQPISNFPWYFVRNLIRLRTRYLLSNVLRRDFDSMEVFRAVGARQGIDLSQEQWEQFAWLWYEPLGRRAEVEDNLPHTLAILRQMGCKLGIVSNTFVSRSSLERQLRELGLLDFFAVQLYSYEFRIRKPNTEIFQIAADRIGEPLANIVFVGDRIDNDILPALDSGMKAVLKDAYTNAGKPTPPGAWRIERLTELPAVIEKINTGVAQPSRT